MPSKGRADPKHSSFQTFGVLSFKRVLLEEKMQLLGRMLSFKIYVPVFIGRLLGKRSWKKETSKKIALEGENAKRLLRTIEQSHGILVG